MTNQMPTCDELMKPLLSALQALGGSGSIDEVYEKVAELEDYSEEVLAQPHNPEKSNRTEVEYRLALARTYLKHYGYLDNSRRGVWVLRQKAKEEPNLSGRLGDLVVSSHGTRIRYWNRVDLSRLSVVP